MEKGVVQTRLDERSYEVLAEDGTTYRRNRGHIRATKEGPSRPVCSGPSTGTGTLVEAEPTSQASTSVPQVDTNAELPEPIAPNPIANPMSQTPVRARQPNVDMANSPRRENSRQQSSPNVRQQSTPNIVCRTRSGRSVVPPRFLKDYQC